MPGALPGVAGWEFGSVLRLPFDGVSARPDGHHGAVRFDPSLKPLVRPWPEAMG